jgi:hypothetical protein
MEDKIASFKQEIEDEETRIKINELMNSDPKKGADAAHKFAQKLVKRRELYMESRGIEIREGELEELLEKELTRLTKELKPNQVQNIKATIAHLQSKIKDTQKDVAANDSMISYFKSTVSIHRKLFCQIFDPHLEIFFFSLYNS